MKKIFLLLILLLIFVPTFAMSTVKINKKDVKVLDVNVLVNGSPIISEFNPYVTKGRTFVPVRELTEGLGAKVNWNGDDMTVSIKFEDRSIVLKINSDVTYVDGKKKVIGEDQVPMLALFKNPRKETKTMIPLRFVSETLGYDVSFDEKTSTALIATNKNVSSKVVEAKSIIKDEDLKDEDIKKNSFENKKEKETTTLQFESKQEMKETRNAKKKNMEKIYKDAGLSEEDYKIDIESRDIKRGISPKGRVKIVLDAGHGGTDSGAVSTIYNSVNEKDLNLIVTRKIYERLLGLDLDVIMTRDSDEYIKLLDRASMSNTSDADIFLSIHFNSTTNSTSNGIEVLYASEKNVLIKKSEQVHFAKILLKHLIDDTGAFNRGVKNRPDLIVLNKTKNVSALCELGFVTNSDDMEKIMDDGYLDTMADSIRDAIVEYINNFRMDN